jgi:hypothetical protein
LRPPSEHGASKTNNYYLSIYETTKKINAFLTNAHTLQPLQHIEKHEKKKGLHLPGFQVSTRIHNQNIDKFFFKQYVR